MSRQVHYLFDKFPNSILGSLNSTATSLSQTRQTHAHIIKTGLFSEIPTTTKLLSLYANHLRFNDAQLVLESIPEPDISSFSTLIYASSKFSLFSDALRLFSKMVSRGLVPDSRVLPCVVKACSGLLLIRVGQQVHGLASASGLVSDSYHDNAFVTSRALHIVNNVSSSATFSLLEMFFHNQERFYNAQTLNISKASVVDQVTKFAAKAIGKSYYSSIQSGFLDRNTDLATRSSFKYGCSRGVYGTPFFFVNGYALPDGGSPIDYNKWRSVLDPLVGNNRA